MRSETAPPRASPICFPFSPVAHLWPETSHPPQRLHPIFRLIRASLHCTQHTPLTRSFYIHLCSTVAQPRRLTVFRGVSMYKNGGCTCIRRGCTPIRSLKNYRSIPLGRSHISGTKNNKWKRQLKRRRDHLESGAFSPAHRVSASPTVPHPVQIIREYRKVPSGDSAEPFDRVKELSPQ